MSLLQLWRLSFFFVGKQSPDCFAVSVSFNGMTGGHSLHLKIHFVTSIITSSYQQQKFYLMFLESNLAYNIDPQSRTIMIRQIIVACSNYLNDKD